MILQKQLIGSNNKSIKYTIKTSLSSIDQSTLKIKTTKMLGIGHVPSKKVVQSVEINQSIGNFEILNRSYSPSPIDNTGLKYTFSKFPEKQIVNDDVPTFDSITITFDSEILTMDNNY